MGISPRSLTIEEAKMIKNFPEIKKDVKKRMESAHDLAGLLEVLKTESASNGGEHLESITTDLFGLYCWIKKLAITMETIERLGKDTNDVPITPVTKIYESYESSYLRELL